jgi:hypothetical protein
MPNNHPGAVQEKAKELGSTASQAAQDLKAKAQEFGSAAWNQAKESASHVAEKAKDAAGVVGRRADDAASAVGGGIRSLAGQVRQNAPHEGLAGSAASGAASALDHGGRYLQEAGLSGMSEDLTNLIRRNPIPALLVGVGIGFVLARLTSPRSS